MRKNKLILSFLTLIISTLFISAQNQKTISGKTLFFHVPEKKMPEIKREVKQQIEYKEQLIQEALGAYIDKLMREKQISNNLLTSVNVTIQNDKNGAGDIEQNLHAKYDYEIIGNAENSIKSQIDDYPSGKYKLGSSKAAMSTMQILKQTVESNLSEFIAKGTKVTIKITGSADASQIKSKIPYTNDYGDIDNFTFFLNDKLSSLSVNQSTGITTNEQLGLLRTLGVRQFMNDYIEPLKSTNNSFQHYVQISNEVGGKNRRVTIELIVHDAVRNIKPETLANIEMPNVKEVSKGSDVDVNIPVSGKQRDNVYAIVIGNEDYSKSQSDKNVEVNVDYAVNDAEVFKEYCTKTLGLKENRITLIRNGSFATIDGAIDRLVNLSSNLRDSMEIIFYYSGHGLPDEKTKEAYLIPVDIKGTSMKYAIKVDSLYQRLSTYSPKKVTVILDACFSGGGRNKGLLSLKGVKVKAKEQEVKGNVVVFTSSSGTESSTVYKEKEHGMFTYFLLKRLQETKGEATLKDLADYVTKNVKIESLMVNEKDQTPTVIGSESVMDKWENWKLRE
jgi:hypothetical protein